MAFTKDRIVRQSQLLNEQKTISPTRPYKPEHHLDENWPDIFPEVELYQPAQGKYDRSPAKKKEVLIKDPRPDLAEEDPEESYWWCMLLADAWAVNRQLAGTLHGFRCMGTRLIKTENGSILKPEVSDRAWTSQEEYQEARDKYLVPHRPVLTELLKRLL